MKKSLFQINKMDCPSEENLIRVKLNEHNTIVKLDFMLDKNQLIVFHDGNEHSILKTLESLSLGTTLLKTEIISQKVEVNNRSQTQLLWQVLTINFVFFVVEIVFGLSSNSMGLVADSLDMLSDSFVYGLSLLAVGASIIKQKRIAKLSGYIQLFLACVGVVEVIRRYFFEEQLPDYSTMIIVSIFALIANYLCLYLLQKSKSEDVHMKAVMIFTNNDIIINFGVILAGILVLLASSKLPDLIIGTIVFAIVFRGAFRILKLAK